MTIPVPGGNYGGGQGQSPGGVATSGIANSGGGGGGGQAAGWTYTSGGSGLIIIRGMDGDNIPIVYNGIRLTALNFVNGASPAVKVTSVIYNGTKLY